jgi:hypothetical protein
MAWHVRNVLHFGIRFSCGFTHHITPEAMIRNAERMKSVYFT